VKNTTPGDDKRLQGFGSVLVVEPGKRRFCSVLN
jgi:hypothetical protein